MKVNHNAWIKAVIWVTFCYSIESYGNIVRTIKIDTSPLIDHVAGPFSLNFQLTDGEGIGDGNTIVTLDHFDFGGGSIIGSPTLLGNVSDFLPSSISFTDGQFFNAFTQGFLPGSELSFNLTATESIDPNGTPDQFSLAILDSTGAELPTLGFFDAFLVLDFDALNPPAQTFGSDISRTPHGGGSSINITAPTIKEGRTVPIIGTISLFLIGFSVLIFSARNGPLFRAGKFP